MANRWTSEELQRLRELYPTRPMTELEAAFPGRTPGNIYSKAKDDGLRKAPGAKAPISRAPNPHQFRRWTDKELELFVEIYPSSPLDEVLILLPGKTLAQIYQAAFKLRLKRVRIPKSEPEPTLHPLPKVAKPPQPPKAARRKVDPVRFSDADIALLNELSDGSTRSLSLGELKMLFPRQGLDKLVKRVRDLGFKVSMPEAKAISDGETLP